MTHSPIVKQGRCGMSQPEVGHTQKGVLSSGPQFRLVEPGEKLSLSERWQYSKWQLSLVNVGSHEWNWLPEFDSDDDGRPFQLKIVLRYRIANPWPIVRDNIHDLESMLTMELRGELRSIARQYRLNAHKQAAKRIAEAIMDDSAFGRLGLELDRDVVVSVRLSEEDQRFANELDILERARELPRQQRFTTELPSEQVTYGFTVVATVQYLLSEVSRISTLEELEQAVKLMWETNIVKVMSRVCRNYTFQQVVAAQDALDRELDSQVFNEFGIRVVNVLATLDLNTASRDVATFDEAKAIEHGREITDLEHKHNLQDKEQERLLAKVLTNHMAYLATMLAQGEQNMEWVLNYIDQQRLDLPIKTITELRELKVLDMDMAQNAAQTILAGLLTSTAARPDARHIDVFMDAMRTSGQVPDQAENTDENEQEVHQ